MAELLFKERKRTLFGLPLSFTVYSFDEERLYIKRGFFTITEDEVRLYRILDLSVRSTLGQRIFGLGSIIVDSSDKTLKQFEIKNIKKAKEIKEQLSKLVEEERQRKRITGREYMGDDHDHCHDDDGYDEH